MQFPWFTKKIERGPRFLEEGVKYKIIENNNLLFPLKARGPGPFGLHLVHSCISSTCACFLIR